MDGNKELDMDEEVDLSLIRGYDIMAMVLCLIISVAIGMCWLTWRFRYKIVLRTRDTENVTHVTKLVAMTIENMMAEKEQAEQQQNHRISHELAGKRMADQPRRKSSLNINSIKLTSGGALPNPNSLQIPEQPSQLKHPLDSLQE